MLGRWTAQAQGNTPAARAALARALAHAEPGGYVRIFVDEGAPVPALLSRLLEPQQGPAHAPRDANHRSAFGSFMNTYAEA